MPSPYTAANQQPPLATQGEDDSGGGGADQPVNREAFAAACGEHLDQVWRQLRAMGVAESSLDDATQEVFLTAYRKLNTFEGRAKVGTWLYAIAYRVGCNYRRTARRTAATQLIETEHSGATRDPEQTLEDKQAALLVQQFCDRLSTKLRDVFVLCLLEGRPITEVAQVLELPVNTVHSRVRLVRAAFRETLATAEESKQ